MGKRKTCYKTKKRHFHGNRYTKVDIENVVDCETPPSASRRKLKCDTPEPQFTQEHGYMIFDLNILFKEITKLLRCVCGGEVYLVISVVGLGGKVTITCEHCGQIGNFFNSIMLGEKKRVYSINRQIVYAMRCLGHGLAGLRMFCALLNLAQPVKETTYNIIVDKILDVTKTVAEESMTQGATDEKAIANSNAIAVSCDGSWLTRGHTSQHGVAAVIGKKSGKVLDTEVLSVNCKACQTWKRKKDTVQYAEWLEDHADSCSINHHGTSGGMEVEGIKNIFLRSEKKHKLQYVEYIGDGDNKTYKAVSEIQPYGPQNPVIKLECVGHVQKRMGTRLRKLKEELKGKKLSDGKSISGKNRLTDVVINTLTSYYGNAIRANTTSVEEMKKAIWAIWFHKASTDEKPMHDACPNGVDTWCPYQKSIQNGTIRSFKHKNNIALPIMEAIKPVFKDLSEPELLKRCLGGNTQNSNESFHSKIWKICPKTGFFGKRIVQIGTHDAVITFNDGLIGRVKVLQGLGIPLGPQVINFMKHEDAKRIQSAEKRMAESTKEARKARKKLKLEDEKMRKNKEGVCYVPGGH